MAFIDYDTIATITDKRIVKSRKVIFESLISLLAEKPLESITVTELCKKAMLNRKTFYTQFSSVAVAFESLQVNIIRTYLQKLMAADILSSGGFHPAEFIRFTDKLINENIENFNIIYSHIRRGNYVKLLGTDLGNLGNSFLRQNHSNEFSKSYVSALVFTVTGLLNFYFDWMDNDRPLPLNELASLANSLTAYPLGDIVNLRRLH